MKFICDSGSTKADWVLIDRNKLVSEFQTDGLNPVHLTEEKLIKILSGEKKLTGIAPSVTEIHFFGAGCGSAEGQSRMIKVLGNCFSSAAISVDNDLMAAAL